MTTRPGWTPLIGDRSLRYSPVWIRLVDDVTGAEPVERVRVLLDLRDDAGQWRPTGVGAYISQTGTVAFPRLDYRQSVAGVPVRRYRVRIEAQRYRPLYRASEGGIELDVPPHDDDTKTAPVRRDVVLLPSVTYPYQAHVRPLRGDVVDESGTVVADALVECVVAVGGGARRERTLTDERGAYGLALRWVVAGGTADITAIDQRTGRTGTLTVTVPDDLDRSQRITIRPNP